jgi:hypothetical protein
LRFSPFSPSRTPTHPKHSPHPPLVLALSPLGPPAHSRHHLPIDLGRAEPLPNQRKSLILTSLAQLAAGPHTPARPYQWPQPHHSTQSQDSEALEVAHQLLGDVRAARRAEWCFAGFALFLTLSECPLALSSWFAPLHIAKLCAFGGPRVGFGVVHVSGTQPDHTQLHFRRSCHQRQNPCLHRPQRCFSTPGTPPIAAYSCAAPRLRR